MLGSAEEENTKNGNSMLDRIGLLPSFNVLYCDEIIDIIKNLDKFEISEKIDGSNIRFGIDEKGFFTGGNFRGVVKHYTEELYEKTYATTYRRSSHLALQQVLKEMQDAGLKEGSLIEAEVIFDELPNVVPYDTTVNKIILLRVITGDVNLSDVQNAIKDKSLTVNIDRPRTFDGKTVQFVEEEHVWEFCEVPKQRVDPEVASKICNELTKYETFLYSETELPGVTVKDILVHPMNHRHVSVALGEWKKNRGMFIELRNKFSSESYKHVNSIKNALLKELVHNRSSSYGKSCTDGGWIEGLVFKKDNSDFRFKLIDEKMFNEAKDFVWKTRTELYANRSIDATKTFYGRTILTLASSLGQPGLATNFADSILAKTNFSNFPDFDETQDFWIKYTDQRLKDLDVHLEQYKSEYTTAKKVIQGRQFTYNSAIHSRNLQVYEIVLRKINTLKEGAMAAEATAGLAYLLL